MPFPETERFIYRKNPLEEVICQLRYPTILRIDSKSPADFQDCLRDETLKIAYPLYKRKLESPIPQQLVPMLPTEIVGNIANVAHQFSSADGGWTITLNKDFLAVSTKAYRRWEEFREQLEVALSALTKCYKPAFFDRVGLRYRNVITRSKLNLQDAKWCDLFESHIVGELANKNLKEDDFELAYRQILIKVKGGKVLLQHGLHKENEDDEHSYVIDSDTYTEQRTEVKDAIERTHEFNKRSTRLFRWCITGTLHEAMDPEPIEKLENANP